MNTIKISNITNEAASKVKGILLRDQLEQQIEANEQEIYVDFSGITKFASPFFNNSFAALALIYGFHTIQSIQLINISEVGLETYKTSIDNAKIVSDNNECVAQINQIIDNAPKKVVL